MNPLNDDELAWLEDILMKYGNDDSILSVSELDGYFTAIVSGPDVTPASVWLPAMWGGSEHSVEWESAREFHRVMDLLIRHMNQIAAHLLEEPETFEPLLEIRECDEETILIAEEWCFGYMLGVDLAAWPMLPADIEPFLAAIALHGREEDFEQLAAFTLEQHQQSVAKIAPAAIALYRYFLSMREDSVNPVLTSGSAVMLQPVVTGPKTGRNDPCPCGSGKKFKRCCLH